MLPGCGCLLKQLHKNLMHQGYMSSSNSFVRSKYPGSLGLDNGHVEGTHMPVGLAEIWGVPEPGRVTIRHYPCSHQAMR